jgi:hypothetical protein
MSAKGDWEQLLLLLFSPGFQKKRIENEQITVFPDHLKKTKQKDKKKSRSIFF